MVELLLTHEDAQLRYIVLTNHWRLAEHWQTARDFLEHDPDEDCRRMGAASLDALKMNTKDRPTLAVLERVVCNEQEHEMVRISAYAAMKGVIHFDPREQLSMIYTKFDFPKDVDWDMVKSYLPESSDLFADSQMPSENFVSGRTTKKPIPPDLLTQLRSHQQYTQTLGKEGKKLEAEGLDLSELDLFDQNLSEADLAKARFDHAFLRKADLSYAYLGASSFRQAHLDEAILVKADLTRTALTRASLCSIRGQRANFWGADLRHADLSHADLRRASFTQAHLSQAVFRNALLTRASLRKANLTGADLTGAHLNGIFLSGVVGIESVKADWIEVGTDETPTRLEGEAARQWLLDTVSTSPPLTSF